MWSLGCVTFAILAGQLPFGFRDNSNEEPSTEAVPELCNSTDSEGALYQPVNWHGISKRPKNFLLQLLVVDETRRMTVDQAMAHHWFTNRRLKDGFDAVYRKAIRGWTKQFRSADLVQPVIPAGPRRQRLHPLLNRQSSDTSRPRAKTPKAIEPPYMPPHQNVNKLLDQGTRTPSPSIRKTREMKLGSISRVNAQWGKRSNHCDILDDVKELNIRGSPGSPCPKENGHSSGLKRPLRRFMDPPERRRIDKPDGSLTGQLGGAEASSEQFDIFDIKSHKDGPPSERPQSGIDPSCLSRGASFTPINRRGSIRLGTESLHTPHQTYPPWYEGPLISKADAVWRIGPLEQGSARFDSQAETQASVQSSNESAHTNSGLDHHSRAGQPKRGFSHDEAIRETQSSEQMTDGHAVKRRRRLESSRDSSGDKQGQFHECKALGPLPDA